MKRGLLSLVLALSCPVLNALDQPGATDLEARERLAVADFKVVGEIDRPELGVIVAEGVLSRLNDRYRIYERIQLAKLVDEYRIQASALFDQTDLAVQVGQLAKVQSLIVGAIARPQTDYLITARVVDCETGLTKQRETVSLRDLAGLPQALDELVKVMGLAKGAEVLDPRVPTGLDLVRSLYDKGLYREADGALEAYLREHRPSADSHLLQGMIYARQKGKYPYAVHELEEAIKLDPSSVAVRLELVRVHVEVGKNVEQAAHALNEVLRIAPGHAEALEWKRRINLK